MTAQPCPGVLRRHYNLTALCEHPQGHPGPCGLSDDTSPGERVQAALEREERDWMVQQAEVTR